MESLSGRPRGEADRHIAALAELFPAVVTETRDADGTPVRAIDFDKLRQLLSEAAVDGPAERYRLDWPGKRGAQAAANRPSTAVLRPDPAASRDFAETGNLFIEGDNLEVLKLLSTAYVGKVKLIYIDPPYNTGHDFVYHDDYSAGAAEYRHRSGQTDSAGRRLVAGTESDGRFHSDWLSMIYPRLRLARTLLARDGVIFMSINDAEFANLKQVAAEVFGAGNFVGTMVWAAGRKNDSRLISASHEYLVCFARDLTALRGAGIDWKVRKRGLDAIYQAAKRCLAAHPGDYPAASAALKAWFAALPDGDAAKRHRHYRHLDARGVYFAGDISWPGGGGPAYEVRHPVTGRAVAVPSRGWLFTEEVMAAHIAADRVQFGVDETSVPTFKRYLADTEFEVAYSVFYQDGRAASKRLRELMSGKVFDFPKDETVLSTLVAMTTGDDDLVLDFFAGSATTAHAVLAANVADGARRRFIMVQLDELVRAGSGAERAGYRTIAEIGRERIRRAGDRVGADAPGVDRGFRALRLDPAGRSAHRRSVAQLRQSELLDDPARRQTGLDLLFEALPAWGMELSLPLAVETVAGAQLTLAGDELVACLTGPVTPAVIEAMVSRRPRRVLLSDHAFVDDAARTNAEQAFAVGSPHTEIRVL